MNSVLVRRHSCRRPASVGSFVRERTFLHFSGYPPCFGFQEQKFQQASHTAPHRNPCTQIPFASTSSPLGEKRRDDPGFKPALIGAKTLTACFLPFSGYDARPAIDQIDLAFCFVFFLSHEPTWLLQRWLL